MKKTKKRILFMVGFLLAINCFAQDKLLDVLPLENGLVTYTGVVLVDSVSKKELYQRVKRYFVKSYVSSNDVLQLDDVENGEIIGKGTFKCAWVTTFYSTTIFDIFHTLQIEVKDGKYRYTLTDFNVQFTSDGKFFDFPLETYNANRVDNLKYTNYPYFDEKVKEFLREIEVFVKAQDKKDW